MILISVFLGIIAVSEVIAVIRNATTRHLAEQLRILERNCAAHAENAIILQKQMGEQEVRHRRQVDAMLKQEEAMVAKIAELTEALDGKKKERAV